MYQMIHFQALWLESHLVDCENNPRRLLCFSFYIAPGDLGPSLSAIVPSSIANTEQLLHTSRVTQ